MKEVKKEFSRYLCFINQLPVVLEQDEISYGHELCINVLQALESYYESTLTKHIDFDSEVFNKYQFKLLSGYYFFKRINKYYMDNLNKVFPKKYIHGQIKRLRKQYIKEYPNLYPLSSDKTLRYISHTLNSGVDQIQIHIIDRGKEKAYLQSNLCMINYMECIQKNELVLEQNYEPILDKGRLKWNASKTDLIELIYSLYFSGVCRSTSDSIVDLTKEFEKIFNMELKNVYKTYYRITTRDSGPTKFLESLSDQLSVSVEQEKSGNMLF